MKPGMVAFIHEGDFQRFENTGISPMILMDNRSGPSGDIKELLKEDRERIGKGGPYTWTKRDRSEAA